MSYPSASYMYCGNSNKYKNKKILFCLEYYKWFLTMIKMLRIALPVDRNAEDATIFEHFGRAPYYMLVDIENGKIRKIEFIKNPMIDHRPGDIPNMLRYHGVNTLICRGIGRRARTFFQQYGIEIITGAGGKALDAIKMFLEGKLISREYIPRQRWHETEPH